MGEVTDTRIATHARRPRDATEWRPAMLPTSLAGTVASPASGTTSSSSRTSARNGRPFADRLVELTPHSDAARSPALETEPSGRSLLRVLDLLVEGALLVDAAGGMFYRNPALERLLLEDADRGSLLREMRHLALLLPRPTLTVSRGGAPATRGDAKAAPANSLMARDTRTASASYRMRATTLEDALPGAEQAALVTLERLTLALPSAMALADRFKLTACEAGVTLLLAQGHSNGVIAKMLGISPHTARHHTESVLLKLNVHSRAEVGGKVLGTRRPSGPMPAL
jgi:DNA-binding NarL/FixJ family response regulator